MDGNTSPNLVKKNCLVAGLYSFLFPGLGQIYSGHVRRGFFFAIASFVLLLLTYSPVVQWFGTGAFLFFMILAWVLRLIIVVDASLQARKARTSLQSIRWPFHLAFCGFWIVVALTYRQILPVINYTMPGSSMAPNLMPGDQFVMNSLAYNSAGPKAGDLISFRYPKDESVIFAKRVIGLPGDQVEVVEGVVLINGNEIKLESAQDEDGILEGMDDQTLKHASLFKETLGEKQYYVFIKKLREDREYFNKVTVPHDSYFVMGDNRPFSSDSRLWGFVPKDNIMGRVEYVYFSSSWFSFLDL